MKLLDWMNTDRLTMADADETERAVRLARRANRRLAAVVRDERRVLDRLGRRTGSPRSCRQLCDRLALLGLERCLLESLRAEPTRDGLEFLLSSWALRDSYAICTETPDEGMHFFIGVDIDGLAVATGIIQFAYAKRSVAGASGDTRATHRQAIEAAETGHKILVLAHSHPGSGPAATHPSGTDIATHRLWERMTPLVGAIWSRDGYVRFFSAGTPFRVNVAGAHLEQVDEHLWKLRDEFRS